MQSYVDLVKIHCVSKKHPRHFRQ